MAGLPACRQTAAAAVKLETAFLTISGGGNYYFEDEWGMDDINDYTNRGSSGLGYYARISFTCLADVGLGDYFGRGLQIRYINNHANVSDFYKNSDNMKPEDLVNKSHASDERLLIIVIATAQFLTIAF